MQSLFSGFLKSKTTPPKIDLPCKYRKMNICYRDNYLYKCTYCKKCFCQCDCSTFYKSDELPRGNRVST